MDLFNVCYVSQKDRWVPAFLVSLVVETVKKF